VNQRHPASGIDSSAAVSAYAQVRGIASESNSPLRSAAMQSPIPQSVPKSGLHPLVDLDGCMTLIKGNIKIIATIVIVPPNIELPTGTDPSAD
jgi:hypothetical protein